MQNTFLSFSAENIKRGVFTTLTRTHFRTQEWNVECSVAMYSPTICLLSPRLPKSKLASDSAESSTKRHAVNNCTPRSGFLKHHNLGVELGKIILKNSLVEKIECYSILSLPLLFTVIPKMCGWVFRFAER